jgi:hypothetical protein
MQIALQAKELKKKAFTLMWLRSVGSTEALSAVTPSIILKQSLVLRMRNPQAHFHCRVALIAAMRVAQRPRTYVFAPCIF